VLAVAVVLLSGCTGGSGTSSGDASTPQSRTSSEIGPPESTAKSTTDGSARAVAGQVRVLASALAVPWGIAFEPDGSALVSERDTARIVRISPSGAVHPVGTVPGVVASGEGGLLGLAVSPTYAEDGLVYAYLTAASDNRVVRLRVSGAGLSSPTVVFNGLPKAGIHNGGRIAFGPDGLLYVTVGDAGQAERAQDWDYLGGKVLRMTAAGAPAPGNPRTGSVVYTLGHRNPQGLAWGPDGTLYEAEFGQNTQDELNRLRPGHNYGWPIVEGTVGPARSEFTAPLRTWPTGEASPSGLAFADGALWLATLQGQRVYRMAVGAPGQVGAPTALLTGDYGRLRTVAVAPDGSLWVSTSNRDGRGDPIAADDRILRIT
jgi:glucose/arabinose dehydrogenase